MVGDQREPRLGLGGSNMNIHERIDELEKRIKRLEEQMSGMKQPKGLIPRHIG